MTASVVLKVEGLGVSYGNAPALSKVGFSVRAGEIACIVGQNGAGKSSVLKAIAGALPPGASKGRITLHDREITTRKPEEIARMGLSMVPEGRHVFADMTVTENLLIGTYMRRERDTVKDEMQEIFGLFPRLYERRHYTAGLLSGGEQQMLVIGRSVLTQASVMLLDEPSLGLAPKVIDSVYEALLLLRASKGLTLLINEQSSNRIAKYADTIHVLRGGQLRLSGKAADLVNGDPLHEAYFGLSRHAHPLEGDGQ